MAVPISTLPDSSPYGFLSYWYKATTGSGTEATEAPNNSNFTTKHTVIVNHIGNQLRVTLKDKDRSNTLERWSAAVLLLDGKWHNVMIFWDTKLRVITANLDGAAIGLTDLKTADQGSDAFEITYTDYSIAIGGDVDLQDFFIGGLTDVYFKVGKVIDITDPNIIRKFVNVVTGIA